MKHGAIYATLVLIVGLSVTCAGRFQGEEGSLPAASSSAGSIGPEEIPTGYFLGPGDVIQVIFYAEGGHAFSVEQTETATIRQDGTVFLRLLGNIRAAGLTTSGLGAQIEESMRAYLRNPIVVVEIKEYHSQRVTVFGQAGNGVYTLDHPTYLSEFLAFIGGVHSEADQTEIKLTRKDDSVVMVNLKRYYEDGDLGQNILLKDGDQIFVPTQETSRLWTSITQFQNLAAAILTFLSLYLAFEGR
jgi:polysaccharide export outer membrane protein